MPTVATHAFAHRDAERAQWAAAAGHAVFTGTGPLAGYAINWEMPSSREILRANYYDGYDFLSNFTAHSDSLAYMEMTGYDSRYQRGGDASAAGLLTGTATRMLGAIARPLQNKDN